MVSIQFGRRLKLFAWLTLCAMAIAAAACSGQSKAEKLFEQGVLLQKNQKYFPAIEKYEAALKIETDAKLPPNPLVRLKLGDAYLAVGKPEQTIQYANQVLQIKGIKPDQKADALLQTGQARLSLAVSRKKVAPDGRAEYNAEDIAEAVKVVEALRAESPESIEGNLLQARIDQMSGRPGDAERLYKAILGKKPDHGLAMQGLIEIMLGRNDFKQAESLARQAIKAQQQPSPALGSQLALSLKGQERYKEAYDVVYPLIEKDSESLELNQHLLAGDILMNQIDKLRGDGGLMTETDAAPTSGSAKAEFDEAVDRLARLGTAMKGRYPTRPESYFIRGVSYDLQGNPTEAINQYQKAVQISNAKPYRLALAMALMQKKDYVLARQELRNLLRDVPGDRDARLRLAQSYVLEGDSKDALEVLQTLQAENPSDQQIAQIISRLGPQGNDPDALLRDARAAAQRGDTQAAVAAVNRAEALLKEKLAEQPKDAQVRVRLAEIAIGRGDLTGALMNAHEAARLDPQLIELEAGIRGQMGQTREALDLFNQLLAKNPDRWELEMTIAELEARAGRTSDSLARYERVAKSHAADPRPVVGMAAILMAGNPGRALRAMAAGQDKFKSNGNFQIAYARMLIQSGNYAEAADSLARVYAAADSGVKALQGSSDADQRNKAAQARRQVVPIQIELSLAQLLAGRGDAALATIDKARTDSAADVPPEVAQIEAVAYLKTQRPEDALKCLSTLSGRTPRPTSLPMQLALSQAAAGRNRDAIQTMRASDQMTTNAMTLFEAMLEKSPADALRQAIPDLALSFLLGDQALFAPASLSLIESALARIPDDPFILGRKAATLEVLDRREESLAVLERMVGLVADPLPILIAQIDTRIALAERGRDAAQSAAYDKQAIDICRQVLARDAANKGALNRLAQLLQKQGWRDQADATYRKLIEIDPANGQAYNNLAWSLFESKQLDEAARHAETALKLLPGNGGVEDTAGMIALKRGDAKRALALLQSAAEHAPNVAAIRHHLAQALESNGRNAEAAWQLQAIALSSPGYAQMKEVREALRRLEPDAKGKPAAESR
ncbi:MAG: tetratricopeptide repeat protein [Candidatus Sumerlaeia bacterium]